jgi:hypothetical protein
MSTNSSTVGDIRRPVNVAYLVLGLVFLGIAGAWALVAGGALDSNQLGWLLPLTLVGAGVIGLVALAARTFGGGRGGATRLDDLADDQDGRDVQDLEMRAYAPYLSDTERTQVIDDAATTDPEKKEDDR